MPFALASAKANRRKTICCRTDTPAAESDRDFQPGYCHRTRKALRKAGKQFAMLGLILLSVVVDVPALPTSPATAAPIRFDDIGPGRAAWLQGRLLSYRVEVGSHAIEDGRWVLYECASRDQVVRTLWLPAGSTIDPERPVIVRARLEIIRHPASEISGVRIPPQVEYRLLVR